MKVIVALLLSLLASLPAPAQPREASGCSTDIEAALRELNPKQPTPGNVADANCKPWPPSGGKVIAAVMAFEQGEAPERRWVGVLALLDTKTLKPLNSRRFELAEDATTRVGEHSLRLDTANYAVAPGVRALGLRYSDSGPGPSAADESHSDELTLFVPEGRGLRPVFGMSMERARAVEGCLGSCPNAVWDTASFTVAIGPPGPKGWNDLRVTATVTRDGNVQTPNFDTTPRRYHLVYRYDGTGYRQEASQLDWTDFCCTIASMPR
ncbi:MAG: hypothetical protein EKK53_07610 [Burkholderiales bacterium]|nr:MAG: hypothetical protein EKK53_07610 [Burkholderiales bacterium]